MELRGSHCHFQSLISETAEGLSKAELSDLDLFKCVLLTQTNISSMCRDFRVRFLLTEEEREEKRKHSRSRLNNDRNE